MTLSEFNQLNLADVYAWDQGNPALPADQQGNTILVPKGMGFNFIWDPGKRITWIDRKVGSPTFGQLRTQPSPNLKPECVIMNPLQATDVRAGSPFTGNLIKVFKGWGAIWVAGFASVGNLQVNAKYRLRWPVFPDLVMEYKDGNKIFADDPDAGFMRLRALPSRLDTLVLGDNPDSAWYDGSDFMLGQWKILELLFDATDTTMTLVWEGISTFGLANSGFFLARPILDLISTPEIPNTQPVEGTVMEQVRTVALASQAMRVGMTNLEAAVARFQAMMGS